MRVWMIMGVIMFVMMVNVHRGHHQRRVVSLIMRMHMHKTAMAVGMRVTVTVLVRVNTVMRVGMRVFNLTVFVNMAMHYFFLAPIVDHEHRAENESTKQHDCRTGCGIEMITGIHPARSH